MKHLKHKLEHELAMLDQREAERENIELEHETVHLAYKLAKTLYYLCKLEEIKPEQKGVAAEAASPANKMFQ